VVLEVDLHWIDVPEQPGELRRDHALSMSCLDG
jgi:hypothetical protein